MSALNAPHFHDDDKAREYLESVRWPQGPVCPHCGAFGEHYRLEGKTHRKGLLKCCEKECRKQFSVTVGTVFERSKIGLSKWLAAAFLLCSSKKGISAHQLHRTLGVTYKTAWFLAHRIRLAMTDSGGNGLMGSGGGVVEVDETYVGRRPGTKKRAGPGHKEAVIALVERKGKVRSIHVGRITGENLKAALHNNVARDANLMTDNARWYWKLGKDFASHESVNHTHDEYVRGEAHTNTIEGVFSIFKRGLNGVYQHCSSDHLHRYLAEFDFRYNNRVKFGIDDSDRTVLALRGIEGKRLMYRDSSAI